MAGGVVAVLAVEGLARGRAGDLLCVVIALALPRARHRKAEGLPPAQPPRPNPPPATSSTAANRALLPSLSLRCGLLTALPGHHLRPTDHWPDEQDILPIRQGSKGGSPRTKRKLGASLAATVFPAGMYRSHVPCLGTREGLGRGEAGCCFSCNKRHDVGGIRRFFRRIHHLIHHLGRNWWMRLRLSTVHPVTFTINPGPRVQR